MTEHSPAAIAAFPDHHTPALSYCALCARVGWDRTAYDLGAATTWATTREALIVLLESKRADYAGELGDFALLEFYADAILASGALMDVREVQKKALNEAAFDMRSTAFAGEGQATMFLNQRAAEIRG